jgi:DNA-binding transcriptional LysR family regulator
MIETELLRSFAAFGQARNFTRAAKQLGVSQPALFERIQKLESRLGLSLYERSGRELVLTAEGTRVLAFARDIDARLRDFVSELKGEPARASVTLAAGEGSYLYLLGPAIAAFVKHSRAALHLLTTGAKATVDALRCGDAQLGVAVLDIVPRGIDSEDLVRTPLCVAMRRTHPLANKRALSLADLRTDRVILTPDGQLHRDLVSRAIERDASPSSARSARSTDSFLEADGWPLMLKFVELGLGLAVVNGVCHLPPGVVTRPLPELGSVTYRLLTRRGAPLSEEARSLAARIRESAPRA